MAKAILIIILLCSVVVAKPKSGTLRIVSDAPLTILIDGREVSGQSFSLVPGAHSIVMTTQDGASQTRTVEIRSKCVTTLNVSYKPPVIPPPPVIPGPTPCPP